MDPNLDAELMRDRRHSNNTGRRMVQTGSHLGRLARLAKRMRVPLVVGKGETMPTTKINMPFMPRWKRAMLGGIKTMTSRTRKYGEPGDQFDVFGATFELVSVVQVTLQYVAVQCYRQEGVESPQAYMDVWKQLHKNKGYVPEQLVWLHEFKLVEA